MPEPTLTSKCSFCNQPTPVKDLTPTLAAETKQVGQVCPECLERFKSRSKDCFCPSCGKSLQECSCE